MSPKKKPRGFPPCGCLTAGRDRTARPRGPPCHQLVPRHRRRRSRRLLAGALALQHGRGGIALAAASPASAPIPSVADGASCKRPRRLPGDGSAGGEPAQAG